jgi:hypothetical protein
MKVNHEDRFLRRLFPPTRRIYGTTLTKLTVGQLLLLRRIWNPFGRALPLEETPFTPGHQFHLSHRDDELSARVAHCSSVGPCR